MAETPRTLLAAAAASTIVTAARPAAEHRAVHDPALPGGLLRRGEPVVRQLGNLQNILTRFRSRGSSRPVSPLCCAARSICRFASVANATGSWSPISPLQDATVNIANIPAAGRAAIVIALVACCALGAVNAFGITRIGIPSFIMTLAMLQIAAGICAILVRGQIAYTVPAAHPDAGSEVNRRCAVDRDRCGACFCSWAIWC